MRVSHELRKKLERERKARREAEALLGERTIQVTQARAEIARLQQEAKPDLHQEQYMEIIASLHEPMKPLLEAMADLFVLLPRESYAQALKNGVRQELTRLIDVLQTLQERQATPV